MRDRAADITTPALGTINNITTLNKIEALTMTEVEEKTQLYKYYLYLAKSFYKQIQASDNKIHRAIYTDAMRYYRAMAQNIISSWKDIRRVRNANNKTV